MRLCVLALLMLASGHAAAVCSPLGMERPELEALKADAFVIDDPARRDAMLLATVPCLADPDPALRDGFAYDAYAHWLSGEVDPATLKQLQTALLAQLHADDPHGVGRPFAAVVLSFLARVDAQRQWMSTDERQSLIDAASTYLNEI